MTVSKSKQGATRAAWIVAVLGIVLAGCGTRSNVTGGQAQTSGTAGQSSGGQATESTGGTGTALPVKTDSRPLEDPGGIADAAAKIEPSVVTINTAYRPQVRTAFGDEDNPVEPARDIPLGTGSGVIFSSDGLIVTNNHVIRGASQIHVTLQDDRELDGRVIGADPQTDLAVVKVDARDLPAATLADSDKIRVGEWAIAVGDPLRVGTTVTAGIVSALRKSGSAAKRSTAPVSVIQTDAAINPGNSGGALADIQGRLIGINSAIASPNGGNVGIGFAIPINIVRDITRQLIATGRVIRPFLGVAFGTLTPREREGLGPNAPNAGIIIANVIPGGPADNAGLRPGDVVTAIDGTPIASADAMQTLMQGRKVGDSLRLTVARGGASSDMTVRLAERPAPPQQPGPEP